jgi:hypothetical protein
MEDENYYLAEYLTLKNLNDIKKYILVLLVILILQFIKMKQETKIHQKTY